jgi:hypothetical protein
MASHRELNIFLNVGIKLIFLFTPLLVQSQQNLLKSEQAGWAIQLGAGYIYGGNIGLLIERQFHLPKKLRITPFVSNGIGEAGKDSLANRSYWWGLTSGVNLEYGHKHRIILGPQVEAQLLLGKSADLIKRELWSLSFIVGYKGTANFGLIWQVYIGDIYIQDPTVVSKKYDHYSHVGLGLGYKF